MVLEIKASEITALQDEWTAAWHHAPPELHAEESPTLSGVLCRLHYSNFQLWHEEDKARIPNAPDADLAAVKRAIDRLNQSRNDLMESCDRLLLAALEPEGILNPAAPLHSESFGLMIDRLSILALKLFHTRNEIERADAPPGHAQYNRERLAILAEQREDLSNAVDDLWKEVLAGRRRFKLYRQMKMYNEPALNPRVYRSSHK